jgi:hypothetical protein
MSRAFWRGFYIGLQKMGACVCTLPWRWRAEWQRIGEGERPTRKKFSELVEHMSPEAQAEVAQRGAEILGERPTCRVCSGSGFVAQKQTIDDGYGEVDSCPACEDRPTGEGEVE